MVDKIDGKEDNKEQKSSPKVDVEVKNVKVAQKVLEEYGSFLTKTPEWHEITKLNTESKRLSREMQNTFNDYFEREVDSGDVIQMLYKLEKDIITQGPEAARRNNGAALVLPIQLVLSYVTEKVAADGIDGNISVGVLNKFQKDNNLPVTDTFIIDRATISALIHAYSEDFREKSNFEKNPNPEKKPTPEQLAARENKKYKTAISNYFLRDYYLKPMIEDILPSSQEKSDLGDMVPTKQKQEWHDMMRVDGVKSVAFGPSPYTMTKEPWLDLSKLDINTNPKITLKVHTNNNFETSFVVDVKDLTYVKDGQVKVNTPELYKKTRGALIPAYAKARFNGSNAAGVV